MRGHPSIPFLTAAIAALILYRAMASVLMLSNEAIFSIGLTGAILMFAACLLGQLTGHPRKE
jgi:hypothetical protein